MAHLNRSLQASAGLGREPRLVSLETPAAAAFIGGLILKENIDSSS